ncbi:MAG: ABC transporter permease subunit [Candidatus Eisenbacteria bacterium]|nr:ABC transporter permease subunit [Candidatus Eisenbacteria bacterium]
MKNTWTITRKEFRSYFDSPVAYIYITFFLMLSSWLFLRGFFLVGQASMRGFFGILPWLLLFFVPAATMRLWAEEKKLGTIELLMTLPVKDHEVVLGKFLASFFFLTVTLALTFSLPILISVLGDPDGGAIWGGYIGAVLLGASFLAIGLFVSSLTENQIVAFIIGITLIFAFFIVSEEFVLYNAPRPLVPILKFLGLGAHYDSIGRGVIDSRDVIYYLSVIGFFLFLNIRSVESRKWK